MSRTASILERKWEAISGSLFLSQKKMCSQLCSCARGPIIKLKSCSFSIKNGCLKMAEQSLPTSKKKKETHKSAVECLTLET